MHYYHLYTDTLYNYTLLTNPDFIILYSFEKICVHLLYKIICIYIKYNVIKIRIRYFYVTN